jgi:hypothetical protein
MHRSCSLVVALVCAVTSGGVVWAQSRSTGQAAEVLTVPEELAPTPLEAFAAATDARPVWSSFIGELAGPDARVVVTAIVVRRETAPSTVMRGIRLDLVHTKPERNCQLPYLSWSVLCERANAALYFEEARLRQIQTDLTENRPIDGALITTYGWRGPGGSGGGVIVGGYSLEGRTMAELGVLVAQGLGELARAPR